MHRGSPRDVWEISSYNVVSLSFLLIVERILLFTDLRVLEMDADASPKSLVYLSVVLLLAHLGYRASKAYVRDWQAERAVGLKNGCLPQPQLPNRWPLGLDWIRKLWEADSQQHLLAFLCKIVRLSPSLLGDKIASWVHHRSN